MTKFTVKYETGSRCHAGAKIRSDSLSFTLKTLNLGQQMDLLSVQRHPDQQGVTLEQFHEKKVLLRATID